MDFVKKWYRFFKMKNEKEYDEIYFNKVFNRHMYKKNVRSVDMTYICLN